MRIFLEGQSVEVSSLCIAVCSLFLPSPQIPRENEKKVKKRKVLRKHFFLCGSEAKGVRTSSKQGIDVRNRRNKAQKRYRHGEITRTHVGISSFHFSFFFFNQEKKNHFFSCRLQLLRFNNSQLVSISSSKSD